jgi:carboxyl-terminal processing protease
LLSETARPRRSWLRSLVRWAGIALACLLLLGVGGLGGVYVDQAYPDATPTIGLRASRGKLDTAHLEEALRVLQAHYYEPKLDYKKLSEGAVRGMVAGLGDPFTDYLDPAQYKRLHDSLAGTPFTGIGIYLEFRSDYPVITGVIPGTPAEKAGIRPDDVILKIDGKDARGLTSDQASAEIRGPEGSTVTLTIQRGDRQQEIKVTRGKISIPFVRSAMLENHVFYVRIYSFGDTAGNEFDAQLKPALAEAKGVVLDLRDDPGGRVDAAESVISRFVSSGEAYELRDRSGQVERHDVSGDHYAAGVPLVVLVNHNSASASEIVSGSLQAHKRAPLIGTKTFGKGSVQLDYPLTDGSDLHITIKRWFLPNGQSVERKGLIPDIEVPLTSRDDMFDVAQPSRGHPRDAQLNRSLEVLAARG